MENNKELYDYKSLTVRKNAKLKGLDALSLFGYQIVETKEYVFTISILFKRESDIKNKEKLDLLFDKCIKEINEIDLYERKKKNKALKFAIIFGIFGMLTFGGGFSLIMEGNDTLLSRILGISIGVLGIILMAINEPIYKSIYQKTLIKSSKKIEKLNFELNDDLKEGNILIKEALE